MHWHYYKREARGLTHHICRVKLDRKVAICEPGWTLTRSILPAPWCWPSNVQVSETSSYCIHDNAVTVAMLLHLSATIKNDSRKCQNSFQQRLRIWYLKEQNQDRFLTPCWKTDRSQSTDLDRRTDVVKVRCYKNGNPLLFKCNHKESKKYDTPKGPSWVKELMRDLCINYIEFIHIYSLKIT